MRSEAFDCFIFLFRICSIWRTAFNKMRELFLAVLCVVILAANGYQVNFVGYQQSDQPIELLIKKFNKCGKNAYYDIFTGACNNCSQCNKNEFVVDACTVFDDTVCSTCADQTFVNTYAYRRNCGKLHAAIHDGVVRPYPLFNPDRVRILPVKRLERKDDIADENSIIVDTPTLSERKIVEPYDDDSNAEFESDEDEYFESRIVQPVNRKFKPGRLVPMRQADDDDDFDSNSIETASDEDSKDDSDMLESKESNEEDNTISEEDASVDSSISEEADQDVSESDEDDEDDQQIVEIGSVAMKIAPKYRALLERENEFKKSGEIHDVSDIIRNFPYNRKDLLSEKDIEEDSKSSESDEDSDEANVDALIHTIELKYGEAEFQLEDEYNNNINSHRARIVLFFLYFLGAFVVMVAFCCIRRARNNTRTYIVTPPMMTPEDKKNIIRAFDHIKKSRRGQFKYQPIEEFV
uniref:TNFR-Cys domain-containing protein n=1 Tax=Panagrellus redivivus TaxID=6233 RepID=A0A7E4VA60_PANRE